jgi:thiol:disulfide interchange protein DsbG
MESMISGYLYDEKGKNLSEGYFQKEIYAPLGRKCGKSSMRRIR